jgi:hypothetical protein
MGKSHMKVVDKGWADFFERIKILAKDNYSTKVGVLGDTSKGGATRDGGMTNAQIAVILEYGSEAAGIPARPVLVPTYQKERDRLGRMSVTLMTRVVLGDSTVEQALGILGAHLVAEVKKAITTGPGVSPPNAPSVAARKERKGKKSGVRTWVDTGKLVNAFTWQVVKESK